MSTLETEKIKKQIPYEILGESEGVPQYDNTIDNISDQKYHNEGGPDCKLKTPPGLKLDIKVNHDHYERSNLPKWIQGYFDENNKLYPPLTFAYLNNDKGVINVSVMAFLKNEMSNIEFNIYWFFNNNFIIEYNEVPEADKFSFCLINFEIPSIGNAISPGEEIKVSIWDEDPVTSRGTVTTVQPS